MRPLRPLLPILGPVLAALLPGAAAAASFDCAKAATPLERAVCGDPRLSTLDEQLAQAYREALGRLGESAPLLRASQRDWLKSLPAPSPGGDNALVSSDYEARIAALRGIPTYPKADQPVDGEVFTPEPALRDHDVTRRLLRSCPSDSPNGFDAVPAQVVIRARRAAAPQLINLPFVFCGTAGVSVEDYNFDGNPDLAVNNDVALGYGSVGQYIFLFDPASRRFVFSAAFSEAVAAHSAALDPKRKEIEAMNKSGCCYHRSLFYRVENNRPVPVRERIEDATGDISKGMKITERTRVNGRWVEKTFYE